MLPPGADRARAVTDGLQRSAAAFRAAGARVANLSPTPGSEALARCFSTFGRAQDYIRPLQDAWRLVAAAESDVDGITRIDTLPWFCDADRCPGCIGSTPIYTDGSHVDLDFAETIAPLLLHQLIASGVVPPIG